MKIEYKVTHKTLQLTDVLFGLINRGIALRLR
jgi:hypothetical protein